MTSHDEVDGQLIIETNIGETFSYPMADVTAINEQAPTDFPTFDTFKFNNKYNDQLFKDAEGEIVDDTVNVTVGAIGKRLTASFQLTAEDTYVYVNGELQESKVSRLRFDKDIYYLIAKQGSTILLPTADDTDYTMQPYGRFVKVHVDWLTDHAESVPCIYINTEDGQPVTSKEEYLNAEITINGMGVFPDMATTAVQIKGRGNSSWSWPKKPYRLKFEKKVAPLGMTKGKSWVLLANYQTGSLMANAIGMKAANLMETAAPNHIVPVELYMNGEYAGSYNFTEKLGFAGNSIDLDDESAAALLELDSYYDEPEGQKFRSVPYDLPINIKEPDFSEGTSSLTLETVETAFNRFLLALYEGKDVSEFVDVDQLARFLMVNELICNYEVYHPKSTFCYREDFLNDASKYIFGPVWDLDWAFGYEQGRNYFQNNTTSNYWLDMPAFEAREFVRDLRFCNSSLSETYQTLWESFMQDGLTELMEYAQDYYDYAHTSFEHNNERWGDNTNYEAQATTAANWLEQRANQIYEDILNDVRPEPVEAPATDFFDNDKLYTLTCRRGDLVLNADATALDAGQNRTDATDEERQFAILNIDGKNYLYSPFNKKFVNINNTFVDYLGSPCYFTTNHPDGDYQHMILMTSHYDLLYVNNNSWTIVIDSWSTPDQGNRWIITPVADFDPTEALIIAGQLLKGDVNGDGTITIADVTALVNIILGKGNTEYKQAIADVNGDGSITIADVTALVNIILGKN